MDEYIKTAKKKKEFGEHNFEKPIFNENGEKVHILDYFDFDEMIDDYLVELEIRNYSQNTIKTYNSIINSFYEYLKSQEKLFDEKQFIRTFKKFIQHLKRDKEVTQNYIYLVTVSIKKFLEFNHIYFLEEIETPKRTKSLPKSLNEKEVKDLIESATYDENTDSKSQMMTKKRDKLILTLLYSSGLRISELINLVIKDIDFDERTMLIRGKGDKERVVLFDDNTKQLLLDYIESRKIDSKYMFTTKKEII